MKKLLMSSISMLGILLIKLTTANALELPPYEGLDIKIEGKISGKYTDNIAFSKEEKEGTFLATLQFGLDMQYKGKRRALGFVGRINRQVSSGRITNPSENLSLRFINEFSEYSRLSLNNTFTHTLVPDSFEEEFGRIRGRFSSNSNRLNLSYNRDISKHFSVATNYTNGLNWSSSEGITDSYQNNLGFKFNYMHSVATNFSLLYNLATSRFEGGGNITTHSVSTGMTQYITKRLFFNGSVGMVFTPSNIRNSIIVSFTNEIDEKTGASLSFSNGIQIRTDREDIFRNWQITSSLRRHILKNLHGSLLGFYGQGEFASAGVTDRLFGANIMLGFVLWEYKRGGSLTGNFGYIFSKLDSTDENRGHTRSEVNLGATLEL